MRNFSFVAFLLILHIFVSVCFCSSIEYIAAVVDHNAVYNANPNITKQEALKVMNANVDIYEQHIKNATLQSAQIIVFPEDGLYGAAFQTRDQVLPFLESIPDVNQTSRMIVNPCMNASFTSLPILQRLSCLALKYNIVIVANMGDVHYCNPNNSSGPCPADGRWQFNTDVVFDEKGYLIARYHKSHLYYEPQWNTPEPLQPVSFTTNFGVTFGILICFDIMFPQPQSSLLDQGITDFVFTTWWVNVPPIITATQVQQGFSSTTSSNLLASGAGTSWYNSGSGIYQSGTVIQTFYNPTDSTDEILLVGKVVSNNAKKSPQSNNKPEKKYFIDAGIRVSQKPSAPTPPPNFVATPGLKGSLTISEGDLHCNVSYTISKNSPNTNEVFAFIILNGIYNNLFDAQVCSLIRCETLASCEGMQLDTTTIFEAFELYGNFPDTNRLLPMVSMNSAQLPPNGKYTISNEKGKQGVQSTNYEETLLNISMFGLVWGN
eukprot:TRINITY_DN2198_c0_g1_i2.p1 TRINITY_DN2198_c0_g1~~TRINITY_DN2198_c0_g1_i2.p1  ORF type:complete len:551 (-),score=116.62 TRINITY_DN2198_c0_g1_i2:51-1520(-)